jgi:hypothetical protein
VTRANQAKRQSAGRAWEERDEDGEEEEEENGEWEREREGEGTGLSSDLPQCRECGLYYFVDLATHRREPRHLLIADHVASGIFGLGSTSWRCKICNAQSDDPGWLEKHLDGKAHKKKYKAVFGRKGKEDLGLMTGTSSSLPLPLHLTGTDCSDCGETFLNSEIEKHMALLTHQSCAEKRRLGILKFSPDFFLECITCSRSFQNATTFRNHVISRRHLTKVIFYTAPFPCPSSLLSCSPP